MEFDAYEGAKRLGLPDPQMPARLRSSVEVGARFFRAIQAAYDVAALGVRGDTSGSYNKTGIIEAAMRCNAGLVRSQ